MSTYKMILPSWQIPLNSTVTKITGQKPYTLKDRVIVYGEAGDKRELRANDGTVFIVSNTGDINAISNTTELLWEAEKWAILDFLEDE